jgi:hypothetical protein
MELVFATLLVAKLLNQGPRPKINISYYWEGSLRFYGCRDVLFSLRHARHIGHI